MTRISKNKHEFCESPASSNLWKWDYDFLAALSLLRVMRAEFKLNQENIEHIPDFFLHYAIKKKIKHKVLICCKKLQWDFVCWPVLANTSLYV